MKSHSRLDLAIGTDLPCALPAAAWWFNSSQRLQPLSSCCNRRNFGCCCSKPRGYSLAHVRARNRCKRTTRVICPYVPLTAACRENPATRHVASGTQNRKKTYSYLAKFLAIFGNIGQISKDYRNYNPLYIGQYLGHIWATCPKPVMPLRIPVY